MAWEDFKNESTENLWEYIRWKDEPDYAEAAKDAFETLCFRFQADLLKKLRVICKNWGYDEQVAIEIGYKTFECIWKYPKYDHNKSKQKDFDKGVQFYLYGIAKHLLADYKRYEEGPTNPFTGEEEIIYDLPDLEGISSERKSQLQERYNHINNALNRLTPKHKIIYLTYKQYESETKEGYKLPRKLLAKLRNELDLTQNSVRAYKNEAFNEVETYLKIYGTK